MQGTSFRPLADAVVRGLRRQAQDDPVLLALAALGVLLLFAALAVFASVVVAPALLSVGLVDGIERVMGRRPAITA